MSTRQQAAATLLKNRHTGWGMSAQDAIRINYLTYESDELVTKPLRVPREPLNNLPVRHRLLLSLVFYFTQRTS